MMMLDQESDRFFLVKKFDMKISVHYLFVGSLYQNID